MSDLNSVNNLIQLKGQINKRLGLLIQSNKNLLLKINQKVQEDIQQLKVKTVIFGNEINTDIPFSTVSELLRFMVIKNSESNSIYKNIERLIYDDYLHDQDALIINNSELLPRLCNDSKALKTPYLKETIITFQNTIERFIEKESNVTTLNEISNRLKDGINNSQTCITIFQNELNLTDDLFNQTVNFLNLSVNTLLRKNEELFTIWDDGNQRAVNIQVMRLARELATINIEDQTTSELSKSLKPDNDTLIFKNTKPSYKHMQNVTQDEFTCSLCKKIKTPETLPATKQGWDIVIQNGNKYLRLWYQKDGQPCIVYSSTINYCPNCGREL